MPPLRPLMIETQFAHLSDEWTARGVMVNLSMAHLCALRMLPTAETVSVADIKAHCDCPEDDGTLPGQLEPRLPAIVAPLENGGRPVLLSRFSLLSGDASQTTSIVGLAPEQVRYLQVFSGVQRDLNDLESAQYRYVALLTPAPFYAVRGQGDGEWLAGLRDEDELEEFLEVLYGPVLGEMEKLGEAKQQAKSLSSGIGDLTLRVGQKVQAEVRIIRLVYRDGVALHPESGTGQPISA